MLEKGDSVFVNDIMVGVRRANDNPNTPEVLEED